MATIAQWQLLKFGGTSVSTVDNWKNIVAIVKRKHKKGLKLFIVHSALSSVSNRLDELVRVVLSSETNLFEQKYQQLIELHTQLLASLGVDKGLLSQDFAYLHRLLEGAQLLGEVSDRIRAVIMAQGELWATQIGQAYLQKELTLPVLWLDARQYIKAEEVHQNEYLSANCNFKPDSDLQQTIESSQLVLSQGFIASNADADTVLLGRGGSDTSASYFAAKLRAERLEIWTDVAGIFTANPNQVENARLLKSLNYDEAQEMASAGAKVLHPKAIRPAQSQDIPIYIRSTLEPAIQGTKIHHFTNKIGMVKAISARQGVTLLSMESQGMWQQAGFLADLFSIFKKHGISVDLISTSETNVTVSLDSATQVISDKVFRLLSKDLSEICQLEIMNNCSAVSIVGRNVRAILHKISAAFSIFETYKVYLLSQSASDLNLTFVIDDEHCHKVVATLHEMLISNNPNSEILGPTLKEIRTSDEDQTKRKWWDLHRTDILNQVDKQGDCYIYNLASVNNNIENLLSVSALERTFFAVKANNNPQILQLIEQKGLGFETVSIFEVLRILELFPDIDPQRILFTPNFAAKSEYQQALELGILVSLDSSYPLNHWPEIFSEKDLILRLDPNVGKGHHKHVRTAGAGSKFGIPIDDIDELLPLISDFKIRVVGLHAHAGSGILSNVHWAEHAAFLSEIGKKFPLVKYLNLGGGLGVKEHQQQSELKMEQIDESLQKVKQDYPQYELWIEPGRYLVANSGVLVSKVTQIKQKQNYCYIGINTGMNSLMRPALYGSYHPIVNLSRNNDVKTQLATIVGPICESTDKLGIEIPFPVTEEGDVILIENAGAYGHVMSNRYNMRKPAREVCI